jgi:hypothetical protein
MDRKEQALLATSKVPANSGHSVHKGTPREVFIREFLASHLPESVALGSGEIIDAKSKPNETRNQYDIVIYKRHYPKLDFGGGISGFLVESVIATIEVKSLLTEQHLERSIVAARNAKALTPSVTTSFTAGYIPPAILNYVVAYKGPARMDTVCDWIPKLHSRLQIPCQALPTDHDERMKTAAPSIDAVFVLGKGFIYYDNIPVGFATDQVRCDMPDGKWVTVDSESGALLMFFMLLQNATTGIEGRWLQIGPYLESFKIHGFRYRS